MPISFHPKAYDGTSRGEKNGKHKAENSSMEFSAFTILDIKKIKNEKRDKTVAQQPIYFMVCDPVP